MVEIAENHKEYEPPSAALKSIKRFVRYTPQKYFAGLQSINLTNIGTLNRKSRRNKIKSRKRTVSLNDCAGWYVEKWNNEPAHIELLVDNNFDGYPAWILKIGFISAVAFSKTLFHELGHHIHKTQVPEHFEREDVADKWERRVSRNFFLEEVLALFIINCAIQTFIRLVAKKI